MNIGQSEPVMKQEKLVFQNYITKFLSENARARARSLETSFRDSGFSSQIIGAAKIGK